jgi:hypothetical protein
MGRHALRAPQRRRSVSVFLAAVGVVSCGRIGFDEQRDQDASVADVRSFDASGFEAADDGPGARDGQPSADVSQSEDAQPVCSASCFNPNGTTTCVGATCVPVCSTGFADCDADPSNGCETNLLADPQHCGSCTQVCAVDSGSAICQDGACGMSSCAPGTGDCDGVAANGCETDLDTSAANCRFCGNACTFQHAAGSCQGGTCSLGACAPGFDNCDGDPANGCETDLSSTANHCGACGVACTNANGSASCMGGVCKPSCNTGFGDCDTDPVNGCETSTTTTNNCGTCGHVCTSDAGTPACTGGTCDTSCDLSGTWAAKVSLQLTWPSSLTLAAGSGTMGFWALVKGTQSGNAIPVTMVPCEIVIPDFQSSAAGGNEPYGLTFPNSLFDHAPAYLPTTGATVALGGSSPGSSYSVPTVAFLVGLSMTNPTTDAWPSTPEMVTQVDMDQDTKFGVTAPYKIVSPYDAIPVNFAKSARADKAYVASRLAVSFNGTIGAGCQSIAGTATVTHFDTHLVGCELSGGGGDCAQSDSDFTDSNKPAYAAGSATVSLVKIASAGTCVDVRSAL